MGKVSEEFWDAILDSRSYGDIICTLCKRVHFSSFDPGAYEGDELEKLQKKAATNPDKYKEYTDRGVDWGQYNGHQVIYECCEDKITHFEKWVWQHRRSITKYLKAKTEKMVENAKFEHDRVKDLKIQQ